MTQKKEITDKNGVQVFPITHTKAVLDDNGNSVEQRLQEQKDLINQKQLEVGAVPSDLTPTPGSSHWVTSGGVFDFVPSLDYTLSRVGCSADAGAVGEHLYKYVDTVFNKDSGIVWKQGTINNLGQEQSSYSLVRTKEKIPLFRKHVFTYGSISKYTIHFYDYLDRYLGSVTSLSDETEISEDTAYIRIVAGAGNPYVYPSTMINDGWSFLTQRKEAIMPTLLSLPEKVEELESDKEYWQEVDTEEILREDHRCIYKWQSTTVSSTTEYIALTLIYIDAGSYKYVKQSETSNYCLFLRSSSSESIVPSNIIVSDTSENVGYITLDAGYYIRVVSMITNEPTVLLYKTDSISSQEILNNKESIEPISSLINVTGIQSYGNYSKTENIFESSDYSRFATIDGGKNTRRGVLEKILVSVSANGEMRFFLGKIDQRNALTDVRDRYFDINVEAGAHWYDVTNFNIIMEEDDYLFCFVSYFGNAVLTYFSHSNYTVPSGMIPLLNNNGRYDDVNIVSENKNIDITLAWTVKHVSSPFAYSKEIEELNARIESQADIINRAGIIYSNEGEPYTLSIVNGSIIPKTVRFKKVVALGNSLTDHPYNASINWLTHGYAMASTSKETSWTWQFQRVLQRYNITADVHPFNIYKWEANPLIEPSTITSEDTIAEHKRYLSDVLTQDVDCVIFRAGENGNPPIANFTTGLCNLVEYIQERCPSATILMCGLFWHSKSKEDAIISVANRYGLKYIDCGQVGYNREITGGFCWDYDKAEQFMIKVETVGLHTSDEGFYLFANKLASACGLQGIENELHNITISSSVPYQIKSKRGVRNGLISIITSARQNVVVTDEEGNDIPVTIHDITDEHVIAWDFVAVFTMPNCDVNVVIS